MSADDAGFVLLFALFLVATVLWDHQLKKTKEQDIQIRELKSRLRRCLEEKR